MHRIYVTGIAIAVPYGFAYCTLRMSDQPLLEFGSTASCLPTSYYP